MPGKFIVFDGPDGALLTQYRAELSARLRAQGAIVVETKQPSDGPVGGQVRQVLTGRLKVTPRALPLLFLADRIDQLHKVDGILAHLAAGTWVVCARYLLSALACQSDGAALDWLAAINRPCPWPDVMVWCDSAEDAALRQRFAAAVAFYKGQGREVVTLAEHDAAAVSAACAALAMGEAA